MRHDSRVWRISRYAAAGAALIAVASPGAGAEPFRIAGVVESGHHPAIPILWSIRVADGPIFQHAGGGDHPPDASDIQADPSLEFDSYITIDGAGFSTAMYTANTAMQIIPDHDYWPTPQALNYGAAYVVGGVASGLHAVGGVGYDAVAFARLTSSDPGDVVFVDAVFALIRERPGTPEEQTIRLELALGRFATEGTLFPALIPGTALQPYTILADQYNVIIHGQPRRVFDLYIAAVVPAPGAAASLGLAGLLAIRRRR